MEVKGKSDKQYMFQPPDDMASPRVRPVRAVTRSRRQRQENKLIAS